jgi:hypothetical protein
MRVMGLDVSVTATGVAVVGLPSDLKVPGLGTLFRSHWVTRAGYSLPLDATFEEVHRRIERINATVIDACISFDPDLVAIECPVPISQGQSADFGNVAKMQIWTMNYILQHTIFKIGKPVAMIPLGEWRSFFGISAPQVKKENPDAKSRDRSGILKTLVRDRIRERYNVNFESKEHNEAEAFAIAQYAMFRAEHPKPIQEALFENKKKKRGRK